MITDFNMPRLDGLELVRSLLTIRRDLPVVLSTGFSATLTKESARAMGIRELLPKPYDRSTLVETVGRALKGTAALGNEPRD